MELLTWDDGGLRLAAALLARERVLRLARVRGALVGTRRAHHQHVAARPAHYVPTTWEPREHLLSPLNNKITIHINSIIYISFKGEFILADILVLDILNSQSLNANTVALYRAVK